MSSLFFIFNEKQSLENVLNDRSLLNEIIDDFNNDGPKLIQDIKKAIKENHAGHLELAAHTLKSCFANFGAPEAVAVSLQLEIMGRQGVMVGSEDMVKILEGLFTELMNELRRFKSQN